MLPTLSSLPVMTSVALATTISSTCFSSASETPQVPLQTLNYLFNEQIFQTVTVSSVIKSDKWTGSVVLKAVADLTTTDGASNLYGMTPSFGGNLALAIVMGIFLACQSVLGVWFEQWTFCVTYFLGCASEMIGYIFRTISANNETDKLPYVAQSVCLNIAPIFIMAGIYFLLGQLLVVYGKEFGLVKPRTYSYIFVSCDVISLFVQGGGGGLAASSSSSETGLYIIMGGLIFQVLTMSIFLCLFGSFLLKISFGMDEKLEPLFNPVYPTLRSRKLFKIFPFAILLGVILVYTRCIFRVVEFAQGRLGYLSTHETYLMIFEGLLMSMTCLVFCVFHPGVVYGKGVRIRLNEKEVDIDDGYFKKKNYFKRIPPL